MNVAEQGAVDFAPKIGGTFSCSWVSRRVMNASSEITIPADSNASVDGRAVTAECAEPRKGLKTVSKLLHPQRSAFGAAS